MSSRRGRSRSPSPCRLWRLILQLRRNALVTWGEPAYELDIIGRPFLGRPSYLVNAPKAIRRILVDNHANYGRSPATFRILHPMIGDGLFLAEGAAWRHQRRTAAPVFAARSMAMVAGQATTVAGETVERLRAGAAGPVNLLPVVQRLALEVAGRSLLSTPMAGHGNAVRAGIETYGRRFARPLLPGLPASGRGAASPGARCAASPGATSRRSWHGSSPSARARG